MVVDIERQVDALDISWSCADGDTHHAIFSGTAIRPLKVTELKNKFGKVTDWTLNGFGGPGTTESTSTGLPYDCPIDSPVDWSTPKFTFTSTNVVQVTHGGTTFELPVTPLAVPAA